MTGNDDKHEGHEEIEALEEESAHGPGVRVSSPLSLEAERVMHQTIGCAIAVHRVLGPGFLESIYRAALCLELDAQRIGFEQERPVRVAYRGVEIPGQRIDLIVEGLIVVELKAVVQLADVHRAQLVSYLRTTGLRGGLLINFGARFLKDGLKRVVL
jgi:GxxExxY protein